MDIVSIVIPTLNRQKSLERAVASLRAQVPGSDIRIEIVVVDNSRDSSAHATVAAFGSEGWTIRYINEPTPGIATARNAGVRAATGRWIAFLDDDEEAAPDWIAQMVATMRATNADAAFGPVDAGLAEAKQAGGFARYFSRTIDRADRSDITDLSAYLGTNNSMFDRARCLDQGEPFDTSLNEIGGEDSLLLRRLVMSGRRFAWAAHARVVEWPAERRLNWAYVRKRKFLSGQIRVFVQQMADPGRADRIILWMCVGLAQCLLGGAAAIALWPFDRARSAHASATAYGGLGKVLWAPKFRPHLYGSGLVS